MNLKKEIKNKVMEKERFNAITELYTEIEQLRELQQQIREFQENHKESPCVFSMDMLEQLDIKIDELKQKIVDYHE